MTPPKLEPVEYVGPENRISVRYKLANTIEILPIDIVVGRERHGHGKLIDISGAGAAFHAHADLVVGRDYTLVVRELGTFPAKIIRRFDTTNYGARFLIERSAVKTLERKLQALVNQ